MLIAADAFCPETTTQKRCAKKKSSMSSNSLIQGTWADDPAHFLRPRGMGRRSFLQVGMVAGLGFTLGDLFRMRAMGEAKNYESKEGKAKSVIHIFLPGGIAHQESFDPKPYAPVEYRGPLGTVKTKLDGV